MDYFKNLLIGLVTGIAAYLNPISGEIKSLICCICPSISFAGYLLHSLSIMRVFLFKKGLEVYRRSNYFLLPWLAVSTLLVNTKEIRKVRYNVFHLLRIAFSISTG